MKALKQFLSSAFVALLLFNSSLIVAENFVKDLDDDLLYTVKKNDTVWGICKTYVNDPLCWKKLVVYNQLKNPKYLPPQSIIRIPKSWLIDHPTTALVIAVEGEVSVLREVDSLNVKPIEEKLIVGDLLKQQDVVKALKGTAMIKFADESRLLLKANSTIRMASLQFYDPSQLVNTRVELLKGRVKAQVEKIKNKNSSYEIVTPAAVATVRGTEFRVAASRDESSASVMRTELLTGALDVSSDLNQQAIVAGQAVMAIEGKGVFDPVQLLPRPLLRLNESKNMNLPFELEWKSMPKATSYKVTLMDKNNQVWEKTTEGNTLIIEDLDEGAFQILIRGIDAQGFEGRNRRLNISLP